MKALVSRDDKLFVEQVPTPEITGGSVIVKIISTSAVAVLSARKKALALPSSFIAGANAVGRVVVTSSDTTSLEPGQLVLVDSHIRARDAPNDANIILGLFHGTNEKSNRLMQSSWLGGSCAEYTRVPLENAHAVDEELLCGKDGLGYAIEDINYMSPLAIVYGGFRAINVQVGESVVVAPATGHFSGAAVKTALALGARVIAVSRNAGAMEKLKEAFGSERLVTVQTSNNVEETTSRIIGANRGRPVDAFFDIAPPASSGSSTHIESCINALKVRGRVALMGINYDKLPISYFNIMSKQLTIRGVYMYEREEIKDLIKMVEYGVLKIGEKGGLRTIGRYKIDEFEKALEKMENRFAPTDLVFIEP